MRNEFFCEDDNASIENVIRNFDFESAVKTERAGTKRYTVNTFTRKETLLFSDYKVIYCLEVGHDDNAVLIAGAIRRNENNSDRMKDIFKRYG
jgi:hypothetical protein